MQRAGQTAPLLGDTAEANSFNQSECRVKSAGRRFAALPLSNKTLHTAVQCDMPGLWALLSVCYRCRK